MNSPTTPELAPLAALSPNVTNRKPSPGKANATSPFARTTPTRIPAPPSSTPSLQDHLDTESKRRITAELALKRLQSSVDDSLYVARFVSTIFQRAIFQADYHSVYEQEKNNLMSRLARVTAMGEAVIEYSSRKMRTSSMEGDGWKHTALAIGCSALGAAAAVLMIKKVNSSS